MLDYAFLPELLTSAYSFALLKVIHAEHKGCGPDSLVTALNRASSCCSQFGVSCKSSSQSCCVVLVTLSSSNSILPGVRMDHFNSRMLHLSVPQTPSMKSFLTKAGDKTLFWFQIRCLVVPCRLLHPHLKRKEVLRKTACKDVTIKACHSQQHHQPCTCSSTAASCHTTPCTSGASNTQAWESWCQHVDQSCHS